MKEDKEVNLMKETGNIYTGVVKASNMFKGCSRQEIYSRQGSGMIVSMQFIGAANTTVEGDPIWWQGFERTIVEVETDGKVYFRGRIYEFLGMNTDIATIEEYPRHGFYTPLFTKGGKYSGITLNFKIPYYEGVRVTLIEDERDTGVWRMGWITVRDTDKICIEYGGYKIPYGAYLHSDKVIETVQTGQEVTLLDTKESGMVMSVSLFGKSDRFNFVEGCIRSYLHGSTEPTLLSSGFEDYFGFCFGFNLGVLQFPMFGATIHEMAETSKNPYRVSAYRNHIDDPLTFTSGGFRMTVRNSDQNTGFMDLESAENMADDGTGQATALMGGQITYYAWSEK